MMYKLLLLPAFVLIVSCTPKTRFQLLDSEKTGISFENHIEETDSLNVMNFEYIYNGAGVGIVDLDNNGLEDIIFTGNQVSPRIYLNKGNFKFEDITDSFENLDDGQWYSGIAFTDINKDGWADLYFTCTAYNDARLRKNRFYISHGPDSEGNLHYIDEAHKYGIDDDSYTVQASFFDYDLDGDLDLYLLNNWVNDRLSASYRAKKNDGTAVSNDHLYRNDGDTLFKNVTIPAGIIYEGFGLGIALGDVNKDGYPDIYISNDYISNDLLYINQKNGTFKNEIAKYLSYQTKSSMGDDMADVNNDGYPDILTLDMMPIPYYKKKQTINGFAYLYYLNDAKYGYEHQYLRNMLHLHNGFVGNEMIPYSEVGQLAGVYETNWCWSPLFADYDNDGDKDLLVANGYPKDLTDKDWTNFKAETWNFVASQDQLISRAPSVKVPNIAFENEGNLSFVMKSKEWLNAPPSYSYGAAFTDLDNDGDLDYVVNNINDPPFIFKNRTNEQNKETGNYLRIHLKGSIENPYAYGAKVDCWYDGKYQFQEHFLTRGYISSVDPIVHFGLGKAEKVDSVKVTWPSTGQVSLIRDIPANQLIEIDVKESVLSHKYLPVKKDYMFQKADGILQYLHEQNDIIDFYGTQKVLPHKFSQIGPRMQRGDLNGDGLEDVIVGSTNSLPTMVFVRKGNQFVRTEIDGLTGKKEFSEADFAIVDIDRDGDNDVIALAGGYELPEEKYIHYLYTNNGNGSFIRKPLPIAAFPGAVVRTCDYNHNGYPDIFIGARVKKDMYPLADDSWIIMNDHGNLREENTMKFNVGMVTDAVWSDYNGDGWEDLLIAREWNSLMILTNNEGTRLQSTEFPEIEKHHGMWYSIVAGDFDKDGDNDYIVGNLGNNHRFTVNDTYPLHLYAVDIDMNGVIDPISTGYWEDREGKMTEYPINYLDELVGQSNYFSKKYGSYEAFSYASIDDIFDQAIRSRIIYTYQVNTTSSFILWNEGEGNFRWEELPRYAQVSPIKRMIVHDFNRDSLPDVLLAGNDYSWEVSTGYFDANKGQILLSRDGKPLSELQGPSHTGLLLQGMVESLLWFDDSIPMVIAGFNRDSARVYRFYPPHP